MKFLPWKQCVGNKTIVRLNNLKPTLLTVKWNLIKERVVTNETESVSCIIEDENGKVICAIDSEMADAYGKMIQKAPEMFAAIKQFIEGIDNGKLKPRETYNKFSEIISRVKE